MTKPGFLQGMTNEGDWRRYRDGEVSTIEIYRSSDSAMAHPENGAGIPVEIGQFRALLDWVERAKETLERAKQALFEQAPACEQRIKDTLAELAEIQASKAEGGR